MPLDPSIILGVQQPKFDNPMDTMSKAMAFKNLAMKSQTEGLQNQQAQQDFNDNQAMRSAYSNNTTVGPDGTPSLNQQGVLSDLAKSNPSVVPKVAQQFATQKIEMQNAQMTSYAKKMEIAGQISSPAVVTDQKSLDNMRSTAQSLGLPLDQIPTVYDDRETPSILAGLQQRALSAKDQIETKQKQQAMGIQQTEANIKTQELGLSLQKNQSDQTQQTLAALQSARGNPAVQKAENDIYSAKKANSLAALYPDPNKMPKQMVNLYVEELGKIAQGGSATEGTLQGLTPDTLNGALKSAYSKLKNEPTGANAGAFIKQYQDYANSVAGDAKDTLKQNYQGIIESKKPWLTPGSYNTLNQQFLGRLNGDASPSDWTGGSQQPSPGNSGVKNASFTKSSKSTPAQEYAIGTTAKSKSGVPVVYKGNGVWAPQ